MPRKDMYLFDDSNTPLRVAGIRLELFDAVTCTLLDAQNSANLNPAAGALSNEWGSQLTFTPGANPLDVYVTDPTYRYPGNTIRYLNGQTGDRIDIDLMALPAAVPLVPPPPLIATPASLSKWVKGGPWTPGEKRAISNLIFNYARVIVPRLQDFAALPTELQLVADNWEEALRRVGLPPDLLKT